MARFSICSFGFHTVILYSQPLFAEHLTNESVHNLDVQHHDILVCFSPDPLPPPRKKEPRVSRQKAHERVTASGDLVVESCSERGCHRCTLAFARQQQSTIGGEGRASERGYIA